MALIPQEDASAQHLNAAPGWPRISDYAIIGDCRSVALVSLDGAVDWLCWPRFDSPSIFAAILDQDRGGTWKIAPRHGERIRVTRAYVRESNVLRTTFACHNGVVTLTDLMPVSSEQAKRSVLTPEHELIRQVECIAGEVPMQIYFQPRSYYGYASCGFQYRGALGISFVVGDGIYYLRSSVPLQVQSGIAHATWTMRAGDHAHFSFTYGEDSPVVLPPLGEWTHQRIEESIRWWQRWASCTKYDGPYRDAVIRSALALKLLSYAPSGAIVAAGTTSLPERIGSDLNWDYRYCWLRDASLTVRGLIGLGYYDETDSFLGWLLYATRLTQPELRILYTVFGNQSPREHDLSFLSGYRNSRPVRIGNAARDQLQLDVYGEVLDAVAQYAFHGGNFERSTQSVLTKIGNYVARNWDQPDQGIWEPREHPQPHTHSRVLCWTALDRLVTLCEKEYLPHAAVDLFRRERDAIARQVRKRSWNSTINSYVNTLDGNDLDASLLLMSYYGFEAADSDRMQSTYAALRKALSTNNNLIYRYRGGPPEGAFGICSFWEVEYLALGGGPIDRAIQLFEALLKYRNDVGLYAEEIDPNTGDALGNFPQAFTHVGLISAVLSINERLRGIKQLAHRNTSAKETQQL
jgi:GH15 family glucan-1,4-alpha-glucosidase